MRTFLKSVPVIVFALIISSCGAGVVSPSATLPGTPPQPPIAGTSNPPTSTTTVPHTVTTPPPTATISSSKTAIFDFDTSSPAVTTGKSTPFDQTSGGMTAHFSSKYDPGGFSAQNHNSTFFNLSQCSGNYLVDSNPFRNPLSISFSQQITAITLTFATIDYHDPGADGTGSDIKLTAYLDSTGTTAVGSVTTQGTFSIDSYPEGALSFSSSGQPFNIVIIELPFLPQGAVDFMVDNIAITISGS
jgi:hypothetical protein